MALKKKSKNKENSFDIYYGILAFCADKPWTNISEISKKLNIDERHHSFIDLEQLGCIKIEREGGDTVMLQPQGFSTYLSIASQKQSEKQARKAIKFATWALVISILSFIASIVFNILAL